MGWIEGDLARCVLGVLIFLLVICESKGSAYHPLSSHAAFIPNSPLAHAIEEHNSQREINPQRNQAPDVSPVTANKLSSAHANPKATRIRDCGDIYGKSLNTLQHAPAPSPRMLPFNPQNVQPNSGGIRPPITSSSSAKGFKGNLESPALLSSPARNSKKREINASPPYDINPPIEISKKKRRHFAPPPNFNGVGIIPSASSPYIGGPVINQPPSHPPVEISNNKIRNYAPPPYAERRPKIGRAPLRPPIEAPRRNRQHHAPSSYPQGPRLPPVPAPTSEISAAPSPATTSPPSYIIWQIHSPESSPIGPKQSLPPPPPNLDCGPVMCQSPFTNPCSGSPCSCVLPIKVSLRLGVALYIFFPLVSEFAKEIAAGVSMKQRQVRIMGANSATEDPEKTDVLIDLVPLGRSFNSTTSLMTFEKFWKKQVSIQASYFRDYVVLYVNYPGLPPSPPTAYLNGQAYANNNNGRRIHPLGVDVRIRNKKKKMGGTVIAIIALASFITLVLGFGAALFLVLRNRRLPGLLKPNFRSSQPPFSKTSGVDPSSVGIGPSSASASLNSSIATYSGSAKIFTASEMERATNRFDVTRVIGEGGFGRVYEGALEDGTMVAVKVLKRDDRRGKREFLAEVEMLSRLHHRNLVKLIGICTEESARCLVYELIPNDSVESHLHGAHKETSPLDWNARVKVALGSARALAYLHEDSSPPVIHRDLKSSNILLEHDFTPRVSDFGLARSALVEGTEHISTHVMGTFGYVDPEYAMTGHLLVKSDVYSYGVVLLELLTGRKPIDMSQPPGQENLVAWTRPLLAKREGLETIVDPALGAGYPQNSAAKVAAIASMCVQPEVSQRPSMSEIVQALWTESDEHRQSESCSQDEMSVRDVEARGGGDGERPEIDVFYGSSRFAGDDSGSFRRHSSSGPLRAGRRRLFWQRVRGLGSGSLSERGFAHGFWLRRH